MEPFVWVLLIIAIFIIIFICYKYNKSKHNYEKQLKQFKTDLYQQLKSETQQQVNKDIKASFERLSTLNQEITQKQTFNTSLLKIRENELDNLIAEKRRTKETALQFEIDEWAQSAQEAATFNRDQLIKQYKKEIKTTQDELNNLLLEINDYKEKRTAINEEILRARAIEEKQDFYRVQLDDSSINDIKILNRIKNELSKIDLLDKLIYDNYIGKPVNEMIKRVLSGEAPCGIYKITRLKTGEIYIGKSVDVKARWQQHAKSAFHCGTISHSILHTTIERDGIENFTWELIEETTKDKLNEREKYWIEFYDSKKYGLNEKSGG